MVLERYLAREILSTTFAITLVLMIVVMSGRLSTYIADAAVGKLAASLVFPVLLARLPEYLELVLPLSLFLGVLIGLMQLRQTSELTVMTATGFSSARLVRVVLFCALFVALMVSLFSFYVSPRGGQYVNSLVAGQGLQNELSVVTPGRFYLLDDAGGTIYAEKISEDRSLMTQVMLSRVNTGEDGLSQALILADRGYPERAENGGYYFVLEQGQRYEGIPGDADFRITEFDQFHQLMPEPQSIEGKRTRDQTLFFHQLLMPTTSGQLAELNWRISLPILVLVLALIAQPMSQSSPRQGGRYARVLPGVLIYVLYLVGLNAVREAVSKEQASWTAFWLVHALFFFLALLLMSWGHVQQGLRRHTS